MQIYDFFVAKAKVRHIKIREGISQETWGDVESQKGYKWPFLIRLASDNIVVTKSFSEYCNAVLSVVHELHTALFQCSSQLFPLGNTKLQNNRDIYFI